MDFLYVVLAIIFLSLVVQAVAARTRGAGKPSMDRYHEAMTRLGQMSGHVKLLEEPDVPQRHASPAVGAARPARRVSSTLAPPTPPWAKHVAAPSPVEPRTTTPAPEPPRRAAPVVGGEAAAGGGGGGGGPRGRLRSLPAWTGVAAAVVVLGGVAAGVLLTSPSSPRAVPDLVGLSAARAEESATAAGFAWRVVRVPSHAAAAAGRVLAQAPTTSDTLAAGSVVTLHVGAPLASVIVPNVEHRSAAAAEAALRTAGLVARAAPVRAVSTAELALQGDVLRQVPAAGRTEPEYSVVTIDVVRGAASVKVPPAVVGEPLAQAGATLASAQLRVGSTSRAFSRSVPAGHVVRTSPRPRHVVGVGTRIRLVVSAGPPAVVPHLRHVTLSAARAALRAARLKLGAVRYAPGASGVVLAQSASPGSTLSPGTAVALVVGQAPVPRLRGDTLAAARQALGAARLALGMVKYAPGASGVVLAQSVAAGSTVSPGTTVTLVVGQAPVPRLRGDTLAAARQALGAAGLALGMVKGAPGASGVVLAQSVAAGSTLPPGTAVTVVVGQGPPAAHAASPGPTAPPPGGAATAPPRSPGT